MLFVRRFWMIVGSLLACLAAPIAAHAQSTPCASWTPTNVDISASFNPFAPSNVSGNTVMTFNEGILAPIAIFVYLHPHDTTEAGATVTDTTNGNFSLVVPTGTDPNPGPGSPAGDKLAFSPSNPSAPSIATWAFSIPASAFSTSAGSHTVSFDVEVGCKGTGDKRDITTVLNGLTFSYTVTAAMQASFAGTALDFGDITTVTNAQAASHIVNGQINVKSTSPYTVAVSSPSGFIMTPGGGGASVPAQKIGYQLGFLGESAGGNSGGVSTTFTTKTCTAAGSSGVSLPISTTLNEGGSGKASASYKDTISVTFTPLITAPGAVGCP